MSDFPQFPYELLWRASRLHRVANLTRQDGIEFMEIAPRIPVRTNIVEFPLRQANEALAALRKRTRSTARGADAWQHAAQ
jgi:propanol-preferring alcohol dehydrogenase